MVDTTKIYSDYEYLHSVPELGFELFNTKNYVKQTLTDMGIEARDCGKCGVVAILGSGDKTLLLRADMDAVSLEEGPCHACGHDMHTAMLLGAARVLKENEEKLRVRVKLMFQPAEEILEGANDMISSGVLCEPKVDAAFMIHVATGVDLPCGTVIFPGSGEIAPGADYFEIEIAGKGCHGAMPNLGYDPINASAHLIAALQTINSRELSVSEKAVLTFGNVHAGNAKNAIPSFVTMGGSLRTYSEGTRKFVRSRLKDITENVCQAFRTNGIVRFESGCPSFAVDKDLLDKITNCATNLLKEKVITADMIPYGTQGAGSEDFAYVSRQVPTVMVSLAAGEKSQGYEHPLHHPKVKFDKNALPVGSALMSYIAMNF